MPWMLTALLPRHPRHNQSTQHNAGRCEMWEGTPVHEASSRIGGEGDVNSTPMSSDSIQSKNGNAQEHQWATNLRINLDYHQQLNKQLDARDIIERYQAAKALLFERDCKSQSLLNNLREGERIHQEHERKKIMKYLSLSEFRPISSFSSCILAIDGRKSKMSQEGTRSLVERSEGLRIPTPCSPSLRCSLKCPHFTTQ